MVARFRIPNLIFFVGVVLLLANGLWELVGVPSSAVKGIYLFTISVSFFTLCFMHKNASMPMDHIFILSLVFFLFCILVAKKFSIILILSYFQVFSPIFVFIFTTFNLRSFDTSRLETVFFGFILVQILFAFIKLVMIGQGEGGGIGTLSIQAGSLATFITFFICLIGLRQKNMGRTQRGYILVACALLFALINEKRLGILIVSTFGMLMVLINSERSSAGVGFKILKWARTVRISIAIVCAGSILFLGVRFVPSLVEGFSVFELLPRVASYLMQRSGEGVAIGRLAGLIDTVLLSIEETNWLFGKGVTEHFSSYFLPNQNQISTFRASSFVITLTRFGLLGILIYTLFFWSLWRASASDLYNRMFILYLFFDFLIYSDTLFVSHGVTFLSCLLLLQKEYFRELKIGVANSA